MVVKEKCRPDDLCGRGSPEDVIEQSDGETGAVEREGNLRISERADKVEDDIHFLPLLGDVVSDEGVAAEWPAKKYDALVREIVVVDVEHAVERLLKAGGVHCLRPKAHLVLGEGEV